MNVKIYGYARVSTREQNEERQIIALREYGVQDRYIFMDKQSGKDFDRPAYQRMIKIEAGRSSYHKKHRPARAQL